MNLRNLFRVSGILVLITGLMWLVAPKATGASYGIDLDPYAAYYLQLIGTFNIALAILFFLVSGLAHSPVRQAVVTFFFVQQVLSLFVNLIATLGGVLSGSAGWFGVVLNLVFALAFGYFRFIRPEASLTPELQT